MADAIADYRSRFFASKPSKTPAALHRSRTRNPLQSAGGGFDGLQW
jgi:hypothetical protein